MRRPLAALVLGVGLYVLFDLTQNRFLQPGAETNLVPLRAILHDLRHGGMHCVVNLAGNVGAFVPIGFLMAMAWPGRTSPARVATACLAISVLVETLQYRSGLRTADVDDVILNVLGGWLGALPARRLLSDHEDRSK